MEINTDNLRGEDVVKFEELVGKTLIKVESVEDDEIIFITEDEIKYRMVHKSECCETVWIDDICGNLNDLVGSPILKASEDTNKDKHPKGIEAPRNIPIGENSEYTGFTWTFYNIATSKGHVTIRWYGTSNGCYSERAELYKIK